MQDLVRVCSNGDSKCPGQTEISEFDGSFLVDQKVLRLQISVQDSVRVAKFHAGEELVQNFLFFSLDKTSRNLLPLLYLPEEPHSYP